MAARKKTSTRATQSAQPRATRSIPANVSTKKKAPGKGAKASTKPTTIDEYLSHVDATTKALLQQLRETIHELVPEVSECISYAMPAFRYRGKVIAGFLATKAGASYFPFSGSTLGTLSAELAGYSQTKSGLHFTAKAPLPKQLVNTLLQARIAEL